MERQRREFAPEYKNEAVRLVINIGRPVAAVACQLGIKEQTWVGGSRPSAAKRGEANNRGLALEGVIIGWVFLGLGLLFIGLVALAIATDTSTTWASP